MESVKLLSARRNIFLRRSSYARIASVLPAIIAALLLNGCGRSKYPTGMDTRDSFMNGRFQILEVETSYVLWDEKTDRPVVDSVSNWREGNGNVFLLRKKQPKFVVVGLTSFIFSKFNDLSKVTFTDHRKALRALSQE